MANFCKNEDCPTSQELLAFQLGDLPIESSGDIRRHLAACEFCASEVEFYEHYPPAEDQVEPSIMPEPLFELAEALLAKERSASSIEKLIAEINSVSSEKR
ncbi:MAG: hypothetical protein ACT4O9_08415 [Blastocatellia bacterium]